MNAMMAVLMLVASPAPVGGERGWVIEEQVTLPDGGSGWQRTEIAGGRVRRETSGSKEVVMLDAGSDVPIRRLLPGHRWSGIDRARLDGGDTPGPFVEGVGVNGDALDIPAVPFRATGAVETIGGWEAREYVSVAKAPGGMETRLWLADRPAGIPNDVLLAIAERVYARPGSAWAAYFEGMRALNGFPVRTVYRYRVGGRTAEVVITATRIEPATMPASTFAVPAGATRIGESRLPEGEGR